MRVDATQPAGHTSLRVGANTLFRFALLTGSLLACGARTNVLSEPDDAAAPDAPAAAPSYDAGLDAPSLPRDASPASDPLAACSGERNVLYYDVPSSYPGPFQSGAWRFTNHDANWSVWLQPDLEILVTSGSGADVLIRVVMPPGVALVAGTYPQSLANLGPRLSPAFGSSGCGVESGVFTVVEVTRSYDAAGAPQLDSLLAWFEITCKGWAPAPSPIRGCIRYGKSP